jgi:hypothetical protein
MFDWLRRLAGIDPVKADENQATIDELFKHDIGPVNPKYLRRLLPNSVFTRPWTPSRQKTMREFLLRLRPEQREVVYAKGWNKGIRV